MGLSREDAWALLVEWTPSEALRRHARSVEVVMRAAAHQYGSGDADVERWGIAGMLHDADYDQWPETHPDKIVAWLRETDERSAALFEPLAEQITKSTYSTTSLTLDEAREFDRIVASLAASAKAEMGTVNWWAHHANPKHVFGTQSGVWEHVRS